MDFCRNIPVSGGLPVDYQPEQQLISQSSCSKLGSLDDLFSCHKMEEGDVNLEWLSIFVEDCLYSTGNCLPPTVAVVPSNPQGTTTNATNKVPTTTTTTAATTSKPLQFVKPQSENTPSPLHTFVVPSKARSKRKRSPTIPKFPFSSWSHQNFNHEPPLLKQTHWLADSELIFPKKDEPVSFNGYNNGEEVQQGQGPYYGQQQQQQGRRCSHCLSQKTPQWRAGPKGPKTLCNACGVRYKSGRLLPEYRPAKSPTFVSFMHSNSHKKVLEMRNSLMSSSSSSSSSSVRSP